MAIEEPPVAQPAIDPEATCLGCGYLLRELQEPRCPECGQTFDLKDWTTFESPANRTRRRRLLALKIVPTIIWAVICLAPAFLNVWLKLNDVGNPDETAFELILILAIATLARSRVRKWLLRGEIDPAARSERRAKVTFAIFCVIFFFAHGGVVAWSCPHGTSFGVAHFGIAHSPNGGPCRNALPSLKSWHVYGDFYVWTAW